MALKNNITIKLSGPLFDGQAKVQLHRAIKTDLQKIGFQLENEVASNTPEGETGQARRGVTHSVKNTAAGMRLDIYESGPAKSYIEVVEQGRRPNKRKPPPEPIERWLRFSSKGRRFVREIASKYNLSPEKALQRATFLKVRAIGKYGIKAVHMYSNVFKKRRAFAENKIKATIARFANGL